MIRDTTPEVDAIGELHFSGNIIPHTWYTALTLDNGKPDLVAITLLAEICYWYRPVRDNDEATGQPRAVRKKFKGDKLQRYPQAFADQFGFTKRQVEDALARLKHRHKVITTELRVVTLPSGARRGNVPFLAPIPEQIRAITHGPTPSHVTTGKGISIQRETPIPLQQDTPEILDPETSLGEREPRAQDEEDLEGAEQLS